MKPGDVDFNEGVFYGQGFQKEGVMSCWVGLNSPGDHDGDVDVLQDLCGVGYYSLDDQESNCEDFALLPLRELVSPMSYSESYMAAVLAAAERLGVHQGRWVVVQFNFEYDPTKVTEVVHSDPVFLGVFPYSVDE